MNRTFTLILVGVAPLLLGVGLPSCEWGPKSSHFQSLDSDSDDQLSLNEWMAYYGPHSHDWERCAGKDFEPADCDGDMHLSWFEYYRYRFRGIYCTAAPGLLKLTKPQIDEVGERYAITQEMQVCDPGPDTGPRAALGPAYPNRICPE
jgi:hypothetical protein